MAINLTRWQTSHTHVVEDPFDGKRRGLTFTGLFEVLDGAGVNFDFFDFPSQPVSLLAVSLVSASIAEDFGGFSSPLISSPNTSSSLQTPTEPYYGRTTKFVPLVEFFSVLLRRVCLQGFKTLMSVEYDLYLVLRCFGVGMSLL